ncbi:MULTISPECIES: YARHG domain-containing protein [unclassified Nodularia (in: cyanobacteria)]|uniref:protein kinase domain-containing protein n=1 Tax=unclassified Nodularia (in: cyanobacteria) TaxID=2656917 RepID=UPI001881B7B8|nr:MULTISPECIES: YARHG domain-containing protein [unclassified Nodularia (in: cyanobacteria)]MBE9198041.1 YARHG domain-containing protein [Nodularia sp. LEGE 06071]MCC2691653.1 YARHG domain-containing protein [Nodularia sp. LEGE 04288]
MQMLLNNRYQVIRTLGSGGFGETFLAEDTQMPSSRRCVIKQLRPIQNNPQIYQLVQERFQREAAILEDLGGYTDQIPTLYAYFQSEGQFYLVQELIEGDTLTAKLQKQGLFSESAVREILVDLLPVLEYVHSKRIIHRDIKPDNIMLRHRDGKSVLIDFGAVRESMGTVMNSQGLPTSSIVIGTPGYMPSEQAAGRPVYSSDLYSLGLTAIYLLTGKQPQQLESDSQTGEIMWRQYASQVSPTLAGIIDQAIAYHPRDRFPTATAMLEVLHSGVNPVPPTQPIFSPPLTVPVHQQPVTQSNSRRSILMAGVIAGGLIGASVIISQVFRPSPQPVANQEVTPTVTETPVVSSSPVIKKNITSPVIPPQPILPSPTINSYFWLSERSVTDADLDDKDGFELDVMRNSIYARHGRRFDTPGLQAYFNNQTWYNPVYSPKSFPPKLLSPLEQRNAEYISKYQDRNQRRYFPK